MKKPKQRALICPMERIFRTIFCLVTLVSAYFLPISVLTFAVMHIVSAYLIVTVMVSWDPIYAIIRKIQDTMHENALMNGKF